MNLDRVGTGPLPPGLLSRRSVIGGASAATVMAILGFSGFEAPAAQASSAAPQSPADMATLGKTLLGETLRTLQSTVMTDAPWATYSGDWCAVFGSWLFRATGVGYQTLASGLYNAAPHVSSPQAGDIIHYPTEGHVGVVVGNAGGVAQTIEGNGSMGKGYPWQTSFVCYHDKPWATAEFSRPTWPSMTSTTPTPTTKGNGMYLLSDGSNFYLFTAFGWYQLEDPADVARFEKLLNNPAGQTFSDTDIVAMYQVIDTIRAGAFAHPSTI